MAMKIDLSYYKDHEGYLYTVLSNHPSGVNLVYKFCIGGDRVETFTTPALFPNMILITKKEYETLVDKYKLIYKLTK